MMLPRASGPNVLFASVGALGTALSDLNLLATVDPKPLGKSKGAFADSLPAPNFPAEPAIAASNIFPTVCSKFAFLRPA